MSHTPTPWSLVDFGTHAHADNLAYHNYYRIWHQHTTVAGHIDNKGDGEFILRACNSFDEMLAALKAIVGAGPDRWGYGAAHNALDDDIRAKACAAIAKAEGRA